MLYATGEESAAQVRLRAARLGLTSGPAGDRIRVVAETSVDRIAELARADRPGLLVVDSVQTVASDELDGPPGSVGQVREAALRLMELAKADGMPVVLVGHVTKDGTLAGPKTLEHLVDVVLSVEGDRTGGLRLVRATKNRYGSTEEVGVFEMADRGLIEVADPARAFLADHDAPAPGSVVAPVLEGSRPLLVEVQALVAPSGAPSPRRTASGDRPQPAGAAGRRARPAGRDRPVRPRRVREPRRRPDRRASPGSTCRWRSRSPRRSATGPLVDGTVAIGEVGLLGELRPVGGLDRRLREAARLGFTRAIVPRSAPGRERRRVPASSSSSWARSRRRCGPRWPTRSPPSRDAGLTGAAATCRRRGAAC